MEGPKSVQQRTGADLRSDGRTAVDMGMVQSVSGPPPAPIDYSAAGVAPVPTSVSAPNPNASSATTEADLSKASSTATATAPTPLEPTKVVVEPGANKTVLVFKLLDRATGTVLSEIPNQSPQEAAGNPGYKSGALLNQQV
jgi:hypothetical protein